jgi:hypothetical protein
MYRRVCIGEAVIAALTLLAAVAWGLWRNLSVPLPDPQPGGKDLVRIQVGMTVDEVKAILGEPDDTKDGGPFFRGTYTDEVSHCGVSVDVEDGTRIHFMEGEVLYMWRKGMSIDQVGFDQQGRVFWKRHLPPREL